MVYLSKLMERKYTPKKVSQRKEESTERRQERNSFDLVQDLLRNPEERLYELPYSPSFR